MLGVFFFFLKPRIKTGNRDVATRALFWLQRNERLSGSEAFSRVRSRYSHRGISRPDVSFWKSLHTSYADRVSIGPALRSSCGSNADAIRASCPELGLHGAGMVLPLPRVLSLGRHRIELEIKESMVLFTHIPLGRTRLHIYVTKDTVLLASFDHCRFRASSRDSLPRRDTV